MDQTENILIEKENVYSGALSCRGCGWSLLVRHLSSIMGEECVYVVPACCFSIIAGPYPLNALKGTIIHTLFAASAATASGVRAALDLKGKNDTPVVVLAGDGGTFDIGLQALSGAAARKENILFICNNNGAYMNTGVQTSTATPFGAQTATNPSPKIKSTWPKDFMKIIDAHDVSYAATASLSKLEDLRNKINKAKSVNGFRFLMVDSPCPPGHKISPELAIEIARLGVESKVFPLYEVIEKKHYITYFPKNNVSVTSYLEPQGRFRNLYKNDEDNLILKIQDEVDKKWAELLNVAVNG